MKVDVIVIGSGIAGLAIAAALGRQKLKTVVIGPDIPASNFDFEYVFERRTITTLPSLATFSSVNCLSLGFSGSRSETLNEPLLCVDSKSLYQRFLMSCSENGVAMMHGRASNIVSYRKLNRVDWQPNIVGDSKMPKEELFAPLVIDASGANSSFSLSPKGFSTTYRKVVRGSGELFQGDFAYFDFSKTKRKGYPEIISFLRGFKHEDGRYFLDEVVLFDDHEPTTEDELSASLFDRLDRYGFRIEEELESSYFYTPLFAGDFNPRILPFGDAASMAHPLTGEATSRILNVAPALAKGIAQSFAVADGGRAQTPQEIVKVGLEILFPPSHRAFDDAMFFLADDLFINLPQQTAFLGIAIYPPFFRSSFLKNNLDLEVFGTLQDCAKIASQKTFEKFGVFRPSD